MTYNKNNNRCIKVANIIGGGCYTNYDVSNRVYSINGLSPTITTHDNIKILVLWKQKELKK